ncbi:phage tail tube protein [Actinacidiphila glaucinigra]|uniref:phage tail tube protein n=1 Tax=Actinacidiphila glaucinigra TaxID=235986 RepID=UPI0035DA3C24
MDLINDGMTKVCWATSIANINSPTAAECNAALDFTTRVTPDGLKTDPSTADVDNSSLASTFDTKTVGRIGFDCELTCKKGTTTPENLPFTTLKYGVTGYLLVRRGVAYNTAFAAGQKVEVYPVICGEPMNIAPAANEVAKFTSPLKVTDQPNTNATVAA